MSGVIIAGNTSGSVTLDAPAVSGSTVITLPTTSGTMATLTTPSFTTTIGVGNATPSTSGAGITFPATQSASTNANTLDDYEEGTWTPIFTTTGTNFTSGGNTGTGRYIKIGKMVTVLVNAVLSGAVSGGTGDVVITGLPFTVSGSGAGIGAFLSGRVTITTSNYYLVAEGGTSQIGISSLVSGANPTSLPASAVNGNGTPYISGTITYFAND